VDEKLVKKFWRMMENRDVNELLLAAFIEWARKTKKGRMAG
jgi:hypothetical protein